MNKFAEAELRQSQELYQSIFDNTPVLFVLWDPHLKKFSLNPYAEKVIGWTTEEANSFDDFMSVIYPDPDYRHAVSSFMQSLEPGYREWTIKTKSGDRIPIEWANKKLSNDVMIGIGIDLREQKRIESERAAAEKVKAERQKFLNVLDTLPVVIDMIRPDHTVVWQNKACMEALGDNIGKLCFESQFNRTTPCDECQAFIPLKTGKPHNWEWELPTGMTYDIYNFPFHDTDGSPVILEMDIDITARKKAEKELKELNETLEYRVLERTEALHEIQLDLERAQRVGQIGNWRLDLANSRLIWSKETYSIFGIPEGTPQNYETFLSCIHPDDRQSVNTAWKESLTGKDYDIEHRIIVNDQVKWVREKAYLEFDKEGKLTSGFGIVQDITYRYQAEEKLKESESRLRMALESGNIGVWEWNIKSGIITWDERMQKMYGFPAGNTSCSFADFEKLIHEDDLSHFKKAVNASIQSGEPFETIYRINAGKAGTKHISLKAQLTKDLSGKPESFSGVSFDITGLKKGTESLINKLNAELLRSNRELESFAYVASHDLQEPLRMITSFTQLLELQYGDKLDSRAKEYIAFATSGAKRMYELINGLLSYSRINKKEIDLTIVDMSKVIDAVRKNLDYTIKERKVVIKTGKLPSVCADYNQMIHLFQNLISNSIKFSRDTPEITIRAKKEKSSYVFSVSDKGIGIEPQYYEKIFQIFQRLHHREEYDGTGIGLAICKRIVERHGGRIWVDSIHGKGSTFCFSIPAGKSV